ncbi:MAG: hypothetical protein QXQ02_02830 [Halobacteria archaeon]
MASQASSELKGKKILIVGDVRRGKTAYTAKLIQEILKQNPEEDITILDFAPEYGKIGLRVKQYLKRMPKNYYAPEKVAAPRLEGKSGAEVIELAKQNAKNIEPFLKHYLEHPTRYLIINDVSLYLQAGDYELISKCLKKAETAIINSYYGNALLEDIGSNISFIERQKVEKLMKEVDIVIKL